jgi:hypothetical protein
MISLASLLADPELYFVDLYLSNFPLDSPEHKLLSIFAYDTWEKYRRV